MSLIRQVVKENRRKLIQTARSALWSSYHTVKQENSSEPDFVAALVLKGTKELATKWTSIFSNYHITVTITGVYCHQSPKIHFNRMTKNYIEIGDLLWCYFHRDKMGITLRRAILFQAKIKANTPIKNNDDQLILYNQWPRFQYVKPKELEDQERRIQPSSPRIGATYLQIDNNPSLSTKGYPYKTPFQIYVAEYPLIPHADLCVGIVNLLISTSGSRFYDLTQVQRKNQQGWSRVIWDLLYLSNRKFHLHSSGYNAQPRGVSFGPQKHYGHYVSSGFKDSSLSSYILSLQGIEQLPVIYPNDENSDILHPPKTLNDYDDIEGIPTVIVETRERPYD